MRKVIARLFSNMNMLKKMQFIYLVAILIPFSLCGVIYAEHTKTTIQQQSLEAMSTVAQRNSAHVNAWLQSYNTLANMIANNSDFARRMERPYDSVLDALVMYQGIWAQCRINKEAWPGIKNITIYAENPTLHNSIPYLVRMDGYMKGSRQYEEILQMGTAGRWYGARSVDGYEYWNPLNLGDKKGRTQTFSYNRVIYSSQEYAMPVGILTIEISLSELTRLIEAESEFGAFILDWDGKPVASSGAKWQPEYAQALRADGVSTLHVGKETYYASSVPLSNSWRLVTLMSLESALKNANQLRNLGALLLIVISALIVPLILFFSRQISRRQAFLLDKMALFMGGKMILGAPLGGADEIGLLDEQFSSLALELKRSIEERYALQQQKNRYHLKTLQMQINPHFFYNTLSSIAWLSDASPREQIRAAVEHFANFYRVTLSGGRDIITLKEELQGLNAYVELQKIRYVGRVNVYFQADERLMDAKIPKLTLQPLVENCIRHGLNGELEQIGIIVSANEVDGLIEISIQDDGRGMSVEMLEKLLSGAAPSDSGGGLGFRNINERIQLYFGPEYGLDAQSKEGEGTRVTLRIPFRTDADFDPQTGMPRSEGSGEP